MKDYRIEIKVKNNLLFKEIESTGYSILKFCKKYKIAYQSTLELIGMKKPAILKCGKFRKCAIDISTALGVHPEFLFNDEMKYFGFEKNTAFIEMDNEEVQGLLSNSCSDQYLINHSKDMINDVLSNLGARQRSVINHLFGLNGERVHTLTECENIFDVTKERIRQIKLQAMRIMSQPKYKLKSLTEDLTEMRTK